MPNAGITHNFTISDVDGSQKFGFMLPWVNGKRPWILQDSQTLQPRIMTMGELTQAEFPVDIAMTQFQEDWRLGLGGITQRLQPKRLASAIKVETSGKTAKLVLAKQDTHANTIDSEPSEYVPAGFAATGEQFWAFVGRYPIRWNFADQDWDRQTIPTGYDAASLGRNGVDFEGNSYVARWADDVGSGGSYVAADEPSTYFYKAPGDAQYTASTLASDATENDAFKYFAVADNKIWGLYAAVSEDSTQDVSEKVAFDDVSSGEAGGVTELTFTSHTVAGSNRFLVVSVQWSDTTNTRTVSTVTFGATSLTRLGGAANGTTGSDIWYVNNPAAESRTITVTMSQTTDRITAGAISFTNVNQTTQLGSIATNTGSDDTPTVNTTTVTGDMVVDSACMAADTTQTAGASQTERYEQRGAGGGQNQTGAGSTEVATGTTTTMDWTFGSSAAWATCAVALKPITMTSSQTTLGTTATASDDLSAGDVIRVENEYMLAAALGGEITTLVRGYRGTVAVAHANALNIYKITENVHHIHSSTDGTNTGSWGGSTAIGDSSSEITGGVGSDTDLIIFKTDGIYRLESDGTITELRPEMKTTKLPDQGRNPFLWNNRVLIPLHGGGMWELNLQTFVIRDISFSVVMPEQTQYHGRVVAIGGSPTRLYVTVLESGNTQYHVLGAELVTTEDGTDYRWGHMTTISYTTGTDADHAALYYEAITGDNDDVHDRLWIGIESTGSNVMPHFVTGLTGDDVEDAYTDDADPEAVTSAWDGNLPNVDKRFQKVVFTSANLGASAGTDHQIEVQYRLDGGSWTYVTSSSGTSTLTTSPQTLTFASEKTGKVIEWKFLPDRGSTISTSPELHDFTVTCQLRPDAIKVIPMQTYLADHQMMLNGARESRVKLKLTQLKTWNDGANEVTVVAPDKTSYTMVFLPGSLRIRETAKMPKRRAEYLVSFLLASVA